MSITTALEARRDGLRDREAGFTLIELLVVVIIIGILAAIAIPIYLGVQNNAKESATKSDLTNDKTAVVGYAVDNNGNVPPSANFDPSAAGLNLVKYGWSQTTNNTTSLTYTTTGSGTATTWCIDGVSATNPGGTSTVGKFRISSNTSVAPGTCSALGTANY